MNREHRLLDELKERHVQQRLAAAASVERLRSRLEAVELDRDVWRAKFVRADVHRPQIDKHFKYLDSSSIFFFRTNQLLEPSTNERERERDYGYDFLLTLFKAAIS